MYVAGVLLAAGAGRRLGLDVPKALCPLDGVPVLVRAVGALLDSAAIDQLVVVGPAGATGSVLQALDVCLPGHGAVVVDGDRTRHGSLHRAVAALDPRVEIVVVHEVSRPLAPADLVVRVLAAIQRGADIAVPVVEVSETVKELDSAGRIARTVPRESLVRVQAPQAVRRGLLDAAHAACTAADLAGDEIGTLGPPGSSVCTVDGDDAAFAVRWPSDLCFAEAVLAGRSAAG
jgi:2-C-methyl-D-erythritol 4-phosphate cytidylyltransferase